MDDDVVASLAAERRWCLAIILIHKPLRSWRSMWHTRCGSCGLRWETEGNLVGCLPVIEATKILADPRPTEETRFTPPWAR